MKFAILCIPFLIISLLLSVSCSGPEAVSGTGENKTTPAINESNDNLMKYESVYDTGRLRDEISKNEPAYITSWFVYEPEHKLVINLAGDADEIIKKYVKEGSPLAAIVEARSVLYSIQEMEYARGYLWQLKQDLGLPFICDMQINAQTDRLDVGISDPEALNKAEKDGIITIPDCVETHVIDKLVIPKDADGVDSGASIDDLIWSEWWPVSINGTKVIENKYIVPNLYLSYDGSAMGSAGCNDYLGYFTAKGNAIRFSGGIWSMLSCEKAILAQDKAYIACLNKADTYSIQSDTLTIFDRSGRAVLLFERKPHYPMDPADLPGTIWNLFSVNGKQVSGNETGTIRFENDWGTLCGSDPVNDYTMRYKARGDAIVFLSSEVERKILPSGQRAYGTGSHIWFLSRLVSYRIINGQLEIYTADKDTLLFKPLKTTIN
ncbi:MAG: META domain-containing protein [Dehalococcoidales bacterium]|nr:META domain-containing protein [Dehalococcoidales bacterium]